LQVRGKMLERVLTIETTLQRQSADVQPDTTGPAARPAPAAPPGSTPETQDSTIWEAARTRAAALAAEYRFLEAKQAVEKAEVPGDRSNEKTIMTKKLEWLAKFKSMLAADINGAGFPGTITRKNGMVVSGGINKATETTLATKTPYGFVETPWREVSTGSILTMADFFLKLKPEPERGERLWLEGVFALERGIPKEGKALVIEASQMNDQYKDELPVFIDIAE
ncbi:MAG: hypothetical protein M3O82_00100, partial [Verrucomicrobiota bacterium]|nr:hypothetical protein [Verrucomicrobiota bacterium]